MLPGPFVPFSVQHTILFDSLVSIISARSFPRVGHGVGQADTSASKNSHRSSRDIPLRRLSFIIDARDLLNAHLLHLAVLRP